MSHPMIVQAKMFSVQVCVPDEWTDGQVIDFAEENYPSGTENGWQVRQEGDPSLNGDPERNPCGTHEGHVHIVLDA